MRAGFGDQDSRVFRQRVERLRRSRVIIDIPFIIGEQDGKRSQAAFRRLLPPDLGKHLRIRNDKRGRLLERGERRTKAVGGNRHDDASAIEKIADRLHLRQDKPPFGGRDVLRHDEKNRITALGEAAGHAHRVIFRGDSAKNSAPKFC